MAIDGLFDLIGVVAKWWTPEKVKSRARIKLAKLKGEESAILSRQATAKDANRIIIIRRDIKRLQQYLSQN